MTDLNIHTLPNSLIINEGDLSEGQRCNSAKCPLSSAFNRALLNRHMPYYAEVGNYQTVLYDELTRTPKMTLMHGDCLKGWVRFYDERLPVFPVKVDVFNDKNKVNWLVNAVRHLCGDVMCVCPPHKETYIDIEEGDPEVSLMEDFRKDVELPFTFEVTQEHILRLSGIKRNPMRNPITCAFYHAIGKTTRWQCAVSPDCTVIRKKGDRSYSRIFLPNSHKVYMWLLDYNRAGDALPINLVITKKHIEKEGQNLLNK